MKKLEKKDLQFKFVVDTAPLIDYLCDVGVADMLQKEVIDNENVSHVIISPITLTEIFYVLCRQKGETFAKEKVKILNDAVKIEMEFRIRGLAGKYKCERNISLADCYVLATAKINSATAIFKKEKELTIEMEKKEFDIPLRFFE